MWLFTKDGFFSAVNDCYCQNDEIMVRARVRADLIRMLGRLYGAQVERLKLADGIIELEHADYQYRCKLPRRDWVAYVAKMANDIDYASVKDSIIPEHGKPSSISARRKNAMLNVWVAAMDLQPFGRRRFDRR